MKSTPTTKQKRESVLSEIKEHFMELGWKIASKNYDHLLSPSPKGTLPKFRIYFNTRVVRLETRKTSEAGKKWQLVIRNSYSTLNVSDFILEIKLAVVTIK